MTRLPAWPVALLAVTAVHAASARPEPSPYVDNTLLEPRFTSVGVGVIPRYVVPTMAQDRDGFLWIATGDGLVRYDGYSFRAQRRDSPDPAARTLGWIRALLGGSDGRLWIGTEWDGLAVYDPRSERVTPCLGSGEGGEEGERDGGGGGPQPTIRALAEDAAGGIWVGSEGGGLQRIDADCSRSATYRQSPVAGSLPDDRVYALLIDRRGTLWVGTWSGLSRRLAGSDRFEPVLSRPTAGGGGELAGRRVQALFQASDGRIWVGTEQGELAIVDPVTGAGRLFVQAAETADRGAVSSFVELPEGPLWVGRSSGIEVRDPRDGSLLQRLQHDPRRLAGLAGNEVTHLLRDHAGLIWVAGFGLGLQRHDGNNRSLWLRSADLQADSPLSSSDVRSLLQRGNGEIWAATHQAGVVVMDSRLRAVGRLQLSAAGEDAAAAPAAPTAGRALPSARVTAMAEAGDGSVWLGAYGEVYRVAGDGSRRLLARLPHAGGATTRLLAGSDGRLWIGTMDGLFCLYPGTARLLRVARQGGQSLRAEINVLAEGPDAAVWVGSGKGLFRVAADERELQAVEAEAGAGLANPSVIGLLFDRQQTLWLDTAVTGLHRMRSGDGRRARFERVSQRHGVVSRPYGANLLDDARGRIWTHMYVYDPANDRLHELTAADGADLGTGWFFSYAKTHDGRLLFGGSRGILVVRPERFDASAYAPPLRVSEFSINGLRRSAGELQNGLRLDPGQRSFSLSFAALDYGDPGRLRYAYRLVGFDPEWIDTAADSRMASYSNLNPGDYVLRVRASNRAGAWSPHELAIAVHVEPAWWQTFGCRLLGFALLAALLYALAQWRTRRLRARQRELEHTVHERTAELEELALALRHESAALQESSLTDPLTGLRNRRFLSQHIDADAALVVREFDGHARFGASLRDDAGMVFFLFDIDHFKRVNDRFGHGAGDAVLVQMAARLKSVFRDTDYLVRWGGEEFLVVARATPGTHAAELAERSRLAVAGKAFELDDGRPWSMSCSIGFCCYPLSREHATALDWCAAVNIADAALYAVKRAGRDGWLGALSAGDASPEALRRWSRLPFAEWMASGELAHACSSTLAAPAEADGADPSSDREAARGADGDVAVGGLA